MKCDTMYLTMMKGAVIMAQTTLHVRMDEDMKEMFDEFCSDLGMSMSTAVCLFVKQALNEQKIPFELKTSKKKPDVSRRIGAGVGIINLPEGFDEAFDAADAEIAELFENGGNL